MKHKIDLTKGSIVKNIIHLSWPVMLAMAFHTGFNIIDTLFVGRLSAMALAAVSITFPVVFLIIALASGIGIGVSSLIARLLGAKRKKQADNAAEHALLLGIVMTVVFTIAGLTLSKPLFYFVGATEEMMPLILQYTNIIFGGSFFMFLAFMANSILRGTGDMKTPMKIMMLATAINIILDPLLIFGIGIFPRMGVAGSALATIIARAIGSIVAVIYILKGKSDLDLNLKYFKFKFKIIKDIFTVGIPASLSQAVMSLGWFFLMKITALFGPFAIAAYGLAGRLESIAVLPSFGIAAAVITIVGFNVGAKKFKRAEKTAWTAALIVFLFMEAIGIIFFLTSNFWISIFNTNPDILIFGTSYLKIVTLFYGLIGIGTVISAAFQGAGKGYPSFIITTLRLFIVAVPLAYIFAVKLNYGTIGIWLAISISIVVGAIVAVVWFKLGTWKKGKHLKVKEIPEAIS